jgi:predicted signal transduction protein with EAL and GGDEF domain
MGMEVSASIGAAFFPSDGGNAEELLGMANRRMHLHKRAHHEEARYPREAPVAEATLLV